MKRWIRICTWLLPLIVMGLIFHFSASDATESSSLSGGVCEEVVVWVEETFSLELSDEQRMRIIEGIEYPVRKMAHMSEYAILAICVMIAFLANRVLEGKRYRWFLPIVWSMLYACTDELHQRFVPGRDGNLLDVGIDTTGAALGIVFLYIVYRIGCKIREKRRIV